MMCTFVADAPRPHGVRVALQDLLRRLGQTIEKHCQGRIRYAVPNYQLRRVRREMLQLKGAMHRTPSVKPLRKRETS